MVRFASLIFIFFLAIAVPSAWAESSALVHVSPVTNAPIRPSFVHSIEKHLVELVHKTVATLRYSVYKLGGGHFDTKKGVYIVDCSSYIDHLLKKASPHAYTSLVNACGSDTPTSQNYYRFFSNMTRKPKQYWGKVTRVEQLQAGDILVFRYKNAARAQTGGHVMVVMNKPVRKANTYFLRVADSASTGHSYDTRPPHVSGIGIGTLLLKVHPKTHKLFAFAWKNGAAWIKNVDFAMGRPITTS